MSKEPTVAPLAAKKAAPRPRAAFAAATFGNLRAAAGEGRGEALRILLADIDEDPDQPRTVFDDEALESMAESIRAHGVVQPIVVRPPVDGRYRLVFGARRVRASRLAGVADIPAVIRSASQADLAVQLIENQQRTDLSNSDLVAAIGRLVAEGLGNKDIAAICSLRDYQVPAYRQAANFPPELAARIDNADMRALYDLFRQWSKTPAEIVAALPDPDTFITVTEARRIVGDITGKPASSVVLDRRRDAAAAAETAADPGASVTGPEPVPAAPQAGQEAAPAGRGEAAAPAPAAAASAAASGRRKQLEAVPPHVADAAATPRAGAAQHAPAFIVAAGDGQPGRLVVDRRAGRAGFALVAYPTGVEEVDATALRIVRIE